jgi:predicted nucleic acid-binding protein
MSGLVFVDTNILVYAHDAGAGAKHLRAKAALRECWTAGNGCLSLQVLQEFYVTVTRKVARPLTPRLAREILSAYLAWRVVLLNAEDVLAAAEMAERLRLHFWDALILQAARLGQAEVLLSEDFQAGQRIEGVAVHNPLC